ncbi:MAG: argininosuccinate lyase [Bacteroidetes bacterium]|nr:argininosuccinate lyase [Bacteroidota bacterium]
MAVWDSRFKKPLDKKALKFSSSIQVDSNLFNEDIDGSKAHVKMLVKQKIIPSREGNTILKALEQIRKEILTGKLKFDWKKEDIHSLIEERLTDKIGECGKMLHTARSRNDQVALDERLYMRKEIFQLQKLIRSFQKVLLKKADMHKDTIIPGYTHLQRAQPIVFAHHLLAYIEMFERDYERLSDCSKRVERSPLGAAAIAGTSLIIDRAFSAKLLYMNSILENSIDAVSDRDVQIELISNCAVMMMHLSRLAEELVLWNSQEFSFAQFDDSFATGSSLMPQKKNPDIAELVRGKVGRVYGSLIGLLTVMKALPLAYNRDMQEDKFHLFEAINTTKDCLSISIDLINHTTFNKKRFEKELNGDFSLATDLVDYLVKKQIPFRKAHQIVGRVVATCIRQNKKLNELPFDTYKKISKKFERDIFNLLTAENSIKNKKSLGSTSFKEVAKQMRKWRKRNILSDN